MLDDDMRPFGAANVVCGQAKLAVGHVDPRASRVDDQLRAHIVGLIGQFVAQDERIFMPADHADVIHGAGTL